MVEPRSNGITTDRTFINLWTKLPSEHFKKNDRLQCVAIKRGDSCRGAGQLVKLAAVRLDRASILGTGTST